MNGTDQHDALIDDYLRRLEQAASRLTPERRAELVLEIRDHIAEARTSATGPTDEVWTRTLLDRLGTPEEIVAAASEGEPLPPPPPPQWAVPPAVQTVQRRPGTGLELSAVLLLTIGSIIPFVGWIAGVICLWASHRWRTWEKLVGTLIVPGGPLSILWIAVFWVPTRTCSSFSTGGAASGSSPTTVVPATTTCTGFAFAPQVGIPLFVVAIIAPIVVAGWLYARAKARAALEPMREVVVSGGRTGSSWGGLEIAAVVLLAVGAFVVPVVGPVIGLVLAWCSTAWTNAEKVTATAIAAIGLIVPVLLIVGVGFARL